MKTAQLVKVTTTTLYLKDGIVTSEILSPSQKITTLQFFGETKTMRVEEVIERWHLKTKKKPIKDFGIL
jgi:hypothetical protein